MKVRNRGKTKAVRKSAVREGDNGRASDHGAQASVSSQDLATLHKITIALAKAKCLDELSQKAICLGREHLGFDRLGMWFLAPDGRTAHGSFGTDKRGKILDERRRTKRIAPTSIERRILRSRRLCVMQEKTQIETAERRLRETDRAVAGLWDGRKIIGFLFTDNLISRRPLSSRQFHLLGLYAQSVGQLCAWVQTEAVRRQTEATARSLLEAAPEEAMLVDPDGTLRAVNQPMALTLGLSPDQAIGRNIHHLFRRVGISGSRAAITKVLRFRKPLIVRHCRAGKDVEVHLHPLLDEEGRVHRLASFSRDVTAETQAAEALRQSEALFRDLFENAPLSIFEEDFSHRPPLVLRVNRRAEETYGWTKEEFQSLPLSQIVPDSCASDIRRVQESLRRGRPISLESINRRRDGGLFPVRISATLSPTFGLRRVIVMIEDITGRKQAEDALKQQLSFLQTLIDTIPGPIFYKDACGRYLGCNNAFANLLGLPTDRIVGRDALDVLPRERAERYIRQDEELLRGHAPISFELRTRSSDGSMRDIIFNKALFYDPSRRPAGVVAVGVDITERRRVEEDLLTVHRKLVSAREEERQHLAGELHDSVGQELVALQLTIQNALNSNGDGQRDGQVAQALTSLTQKCNAIIQEVRNICHGLYPPTLESLGLVAALQQLAHEQRNHVRVSFRPTEAFCGRRFSPAVEIALFRIAQESVSNALRHGHPTRLNLKLRRERKALILEIADNGRGFDPAVSEGRGLGLTTMRERAKAAGGMLEIRSRPGRTVIQASVPAVPRGS